ncbi:hypothetical protein [Mycolicibacterium septicum]|uniref:hypothetical protein n=1 Tax=Mycolicibacterium septicum TaxID=98668 RepID=UPI001AF3C9C0|nr:hypothetical protein [Mycolicibacterium septicum]QRY51821.1 hypothetical protein JVX95_31355 [Mycolicibacterium septicum]
MTAPLIEVVDLGEYEFSISCEFPGCSEDAIAMCKGCSDPKHAAVCPYHLSAVKKRFDQNIGKQCQTCYRPFMHFDTHYQLADL